MRKKVGDDNGAKPSKYTVVAERRHAVNATTLRTVVVAAQNTEDAERQARDIIGAERTADDQFEIHIVSIMEVASGS